MIKVDEDDPIGELEPSFPDREVTVKRGVNAEEFYELLTEIGRGKFGTVYRCKEKATGLELAAKFVSVAKREDRRNAEREVEIMRQLKHPRLIQLYDAFDTGKLMCVVLELIHGGELFERVIDDDFVLTEKACTVFVRQICEGIDFVHQQNILHLDMKPENILCLTKTGNRIKIIDFGLARKYDPTKKLQVLFGTPEFVAPEVVNFEQISFSTDMWSVGVICYVLLSGLSPFMGETDIETMANVTVAKYDFDDEAFNEISEDAKDFIKNLLVKDKQGRMTAQQCLTHKWLRKRPPTPEKKENVETIIMESPKTPEELDVTKENLRLFVERWSEHPNSPYLFDVITQEITPCASFNSYNGLERTNSQHSVGGCSPSPCGSLNTSPDSVIETDDILYRNEETLQPGSDKQALFNSLHGLERRASDSSCFVHKKADVCTRVNLAEEIKKLSDRLYVLSTINTDLVNNNVNGSEKTVNNEVQSVTEKVPNGIKITNTAKMDTTQSDANGAVSSSTISKTMSKETATNHSKSKSSTNETKSVQQSATNGHSNNSSSLKSFITKTFSSQSSSSESSNKSGNSNGYVNSYASSTASFQTRLTDENYTDSSNNNLPWRRKNKLTNSSRDVPLTPAEKKKGFFGLDFNKKKEKDDDEIKQNSNGETSQPQNGKVKQRFYKKTDENGDVKANANNTKDLLLHLLEQWDENQGPPADFHSGRHKSVSMEWSEAEKIVAKSMNTINTFFRKQASVNSGVKMKQDALTSNGYK